MRFSFALLALLLAALAPPADAAPDSMDAYCTTADVEDAYDTTALAQRTGDRTGQTIDQNALQSAIDRWASAMRPYVMQSYPGVAFGTGEATLREINVEGAYLELAKTRPLGLSDDDRKDRLLLIDRLKSIAAGRSALVLPLGVVLMTPTVDLASSFRANPRRFGRRQWTPPPGVV